MLEFKTETGRRREMKEERKGEGLSVGEEETVGGAGRGRGGGEGKERREGRAKE